MIVRQFRSSLLLNPPPLPQIFEDHMIRDINAGRFSNNTSLVLVTHGLALRVFLMRWFHWSVDQFLDVYNPPNAEVCHTRSPARTSHARACCTLHSRQHVS